MKPSCRRHYLFLLATDRYITVNSGLDVVETAVDELQYANAAYV